MGEWRPRIPEELRERVAALADGRPLDLLARRAIEKWLAEFEGSKGLARQREARLGQRPPTNEELLARQAVVPLKEKSACPHRKEWETKTPLMVICDLAKGGCGHRLR